MAGWLPYELGVISNKEDVKPRGIKPEPVWNGYGWDSGTSDTGYEFRQFLGNCYGFLGDMAALDGMQQLIHHYYLQNGSINAETTAQKIKKLLGKEKAPH